MQGTSREPGPIVGFLMQQITSNRQVLADTIDRMQDARVRARLARLRSSELRHQAHQKLETLSEGLAFARLTGRSGLHSRAPVLPKYSPGALDPMDAVRRQLHEAYAATGDPALRAELMASYDGFARS